MKIVATITDYGSVVHAGGTAEKRSAIIDLGDELPTIIKKYLKSREWADAVSGRYTYESLTFSILDE